jgi:hypothetical protein
MGSAAVPQAMISTRANTNGVNVTALRFLNKRYAMVIPPDSKIAEV